MKYLVKTEIDIPPSGVSIDYLGSWCFKKPCLGINKSYSVFPYIWSNKFKLNQESIKLNQRRKGLFEKFVRIMNEIHKEELPTRYWRILTQSWFDDYVHTFYDRYRTIIEYKEKVGNFQYEALEPEKFETPIDMYKIKSLSDNDPLFNEQLYSQILNADFNQKIKFKKDTFQRNINPESKLSDKIIIASLYCSLETTIGIKNNLNNLGEVCNYPQLEKGCDSYLLSSRRLIFESIGNESIDEFEKLFFKSLAVNTPKLIIEVFHDIRKYVLNNVLLPSLTVTTNDHICNFITQLIMAESAKAGGKLIWGQHGPNYGAFYLAPTHQHEFENPDKFYCWGWAQENDKKMQNMPSLTISERIKHDKENNKKGPLLFISSAGGRYVRRLCSGTTSTDYITYSKHQCNFVKSLRIKISETMSYRPYFTDYEQGIEENIKRIKPNINYINGGNIDQLYNEFRLIILDTPDGTGLGNLLALNKPSLVFFEKNHCHYEPIHSHVFEQLNISGILHYCPVQAAEFVNQIYDNIYNWWNSDEVQKARIEYIKKFAKNNKDYINIWSTQILEEYNKN